jgi:hypothetical protein
LASGSLSGDAQRTELATSAALVVGVVNALPWISHKRSSPDIRLVVTKPGTRLRAGEHLDSQVPGEVALIAQSPVQLI